VEEQRQIFNRFGGDTSRVASPTPEAPHASGRAVDLCFIQDGVKSELCDKMSYSLSKLYIDSPDSQKLFDVMTSVGWIRYSDSETRAGEFWHYEFNTNRWREAKVAKVKECGSPRSCIVRVLKALS
jgi:D-alanyl-D-alanine dipeptidase